jgi:hypothetical protein
MVLTGSATTEARSDSSVWSHCATVKAVKSAVNPRVMTTSSSSDHTVERTVRSLVHSAVSSRRSQDPGAFAGSAVR